MANKRGRERSNSKSAKRYNLAKIGIVLVAVILIFIIYRIFNAVVLKNEQIDLTGNNYYQYLVGLYYEYSGKIELAKKGDIKQLLFENGKVTTLDSTPIYYKDILGKVIFPEKMAVVDAESGAIYKTDEFSVLLKDGTNMNIKKFKKNNTKNIKNTFLYDGRDMYFFLENMTITIGKKKYEVSPLSYAIVNYRQNVEIYNYDKNEYTVVDEKTATSNSDVIATNKNEDYSINMSVDSFKTNSVDQLLIKNMEYINKLDY